MGGLLAGGFAVVVLELWRANLRAPLAYSDDADFYLMLAKNALTHAWPYVNRNLGAPFGQQLYDFALGGDHLDLLFLRGIGVFTSSAALALNVFYLLSFPLSAIAAYAVLRWAGISRLVACSCSVVYALTPYHFARGERHIFLTMDFAVPLGAYLFLGTASGRAMFRRRMVRSGPLAWLTGRTLATLAACIAITSTGEFYYGVFAFLLVGFALIIRIIAERNRGALLNGAAVLILLAVLLAIDLAPTIVYDALHGRNYLAAERLPGEGDVGGLKLAQLLQPVPGHRVRSLADLSRYYNWTATPRTVNTIEQPALGAFASIGFLWLLVVLFATCVGSRRTLPSVIARSRYAAFGAWSAFLFGSIGGIGSVLGYLVTPQIRAWNRISIFIAFFGVLGVAMLLQQLQTRWHARLIMRLLFLAVLAGVTTAAVFDQTTRRDIPPYRAIDRAYSNDAALTRAIERLLPHGAMVFQLPYVAFPEPLPPGRIDSYDGVRPYLQANALRWSYGVMKGRWQDWQQYLVEKPLPEILAGASAAGFSGLYVDLAGYQAPTAGTLVRSLRTMLARPPLASRDGRFLFFDLRHYAARLRRTLGPRELANLRAATLEPPRAVAWRSISPAEERGRTGSRSLFATGREAELNLYEPGHAERTTFFAFLQSAHASAQSRIPSLVTFRWPDGKVETITVERRGAHLSERILLHHGDNLVRIETLGPPIYAPWDRRTLYLQLIDARFQENAFAQFERRPSGAG